MNNQEKLLTAISTLEEIAGLTDHQKDLQYWFATNHRRGVYIGVKKASLIAKECLVRIRDYQPEKQRKNSKIKSLDNGGV